ncbi:DUF4345 family protein [Adhaeretor mobilis]|uniref:DUF4345 domain-containing protein n=1 Tax=Adhaeretor mobilis TaxID=1930276 RepID=A0A517MX41_9BACT|nr:DUF4345 family protein [Adhaeretor mobilis]QDS99387.1 hypothetical protein HG15A2_27100 [Adhaeretor mobilis]
MWAMFVVGAVYLALGIWCTLDPAGTSANVGFQLMDGQGRSEFVTVYGGLEVGLGAAMILTGMSPQLRIGGLAFAAIVSVALVVFRVPTLFRYEVPTKIYLFVIAEIITAAWLSWQYFAIKGTPVELST